MRTHAPLAAALLTAASTLAACKGGGGIDASYFGNAVEPPKGLAKLRPGMTLDEAKATAPGLKEGKDRDEGDWLLDSGNADLKLVVELDDGRVDRLVVKANTTKLEPVLTKAWGAGTKEVDKYSQDEQTVWLNAAGQWKAELRCLERMCFLDFDSYRPLAADWFGKTPVPPGSYAKLKVGMPAAEAATVLGDKLPTEKYVDAGPDDVSIIAQTSKEGFVTSVRLMTPADAKPLLEKAWGPGLVAKDSIDKPLTVWLDEATGWRATWEDQPIGDSGSLSFDNYLSLPALIGAGPADFAALAPAGIGATADELAKAYGAMWNAEDKAIDLRPTAWGSMWTRVHVDFDDAGKAVAFRFGIPYEGHAPAKDQILAALEARFGKPTPVEDLGRTYLVFRDAAPKIMARDETITGEWEISYGSR